MIMAPPWKAFREGISLRKSHDHSMEKGISLMDTIAATPPGMTLSASMRKA